MPRSRVGSVRIGFDITVVITLSFSVEGTPGDLVHRVAGLRAVLLKARGIANIDLFVVERADINRWYVSIKPAGGPFAEDDGFGSVGKAYVDGVKITALLQLRPVAWCQATRISLVKVNVGSQGRLASLCQSGPIPCVIIIQMVISIRALFK